MKTPKEMIAALDELIEAAQKAARCLALSPDDVGIENANDALGTHAWDVDRMLEDAAGEVYERKEEKSRREGIYVAHYTHMGRRHYVMACPESDPPLPEMMQIPVRVKGRRLFTHEQREAYDWAASPAGAKHCSFTRVGKVVTP